MYSWVNKLKQDCSNINTLKEDAKCYSFNHFQGALIRDEEDMTFDEVDEVVKYLTILWCSIKNEKPVFYYENVAEDNGFFKLNSKCSKKKNEKMSNAEKNDIEIQVVTNLQMSVGEDTASDIVRYEVKDGSNFINEVVENVIETSAWEFEGYYNDDDIRLSTGRVLSDIIWNQNDSKIVLVHLKDSENDEYDKDFLISDEFLNKEKIEQLREVEEKWNNYKGGIPCSWMLDVSIYDKSSSTYSVLYDILSELSEKTIGKKAIITNDSIKFIG